MYFNPNNARGSGSRFPHSGYFDSKYPKAEPISIYAFPLPDSKAHRKNKNALKRKADSLPIDNSNFFGPKKPRYNANFQPNQKKLNWNKKNRKQKPASEWQKIPSQEHIYNKIIYVAIFNQTFSSSLPSDESINVKSKPQDLELSHIIKECPLAKLSGNPFVTKMDNEIEQTVESSALPKDTFQSVLKTVIDDLNASVIIEGCTNKWNCFGSYLYGLVAEDSDIDFYYECTDNSSIIKTSQIPSKMRKCLQKSRIFTRVNFIKNARVPVLRANHTGTRKQIDISFSNDLGVRNSLLTKLYLNLNPNLKYLTLYLKGILKQYNTLGTGKITTHILFWLVGFFMQQKKLLPAVIDVRRSSTVKHDVAGWDCSLPEDYSYPTEPVSLYSLLLELIAFYRDFDFLNYVICPFLGRAFLLSDFEQLQIPVDEFSVYLRQLKNPEQCTFSRSAVNLQDPSDLGFNLAKQVTVESANKFKVLCHHLSDLLPDSVSDLGKINTLSRILPNSMNFALYAPYNLTQYCSFIINSKSLPEHCFSKLNQSVVLEAIRKLMELVFEFETKSTTIAPNLTQIFRSDGKITKNTASVIYAEYCSSENTWKNDFIKEIIPRNGDEKEPVKVLLTCEVCLDRNLVRVFIQSDVNFIRFLRENAPRLFSFALKNVVPA